MAAARKAKKKSAKKSKAKSAKKSKRKTLAKKKPARKSATKKRSLSRSKKSGARKAAPKKSKAKKKAKTKRKPNAAFMRPLTPSSALAKIVGAKPLPRTKVVQKLWQYIKKNQLQDSTNRRNINADEKLRPIFGKSTVSMFEMTKIVSKHLS